MHTTKRVLLRDVLLETKDGEWGKADPASSLREMMVIRGADFDEVRYGELNAVPRRFIPVKAAERKTLQPDDILIETAGGTVGRPTGRTLLITDEILRSASIPVTCASFSRFLRPDPDVIFPGYLYWYLQYLYNTKQLDTYQVQHTGVARFQYTDFSRSIQIPLPPMCVQRSIADVLGTFDEKIKVNRDMNKTLQQMAMTLYRYWFVDFGPFQNGRFVESELAMIPQGWSVVSLGDVVGLNKFSRPSKYPFSTIQYVDISSVEVGRLIGTTEFEVSKAPSRAKRLVQDGDVIWSCVRPNRKSYLQMYKPALNTIVSTGFVVLTPEQVPSSFLYAHTTTDVFVEHLTNNAAGSAYPAVRPDAFSTARLVLPPKSVLEEFDRIVAPLYRQVHENEAETRTLSEARDYLIPRLLSGEVQLVESVQ